MSIQYETMYLYDLTLVPPTLSTQYLEGILPFEHFVTYHFFSLLGKFTNDSDTYVVSKTGTFITLYKIKYPKWYTECSINLFVRIKCYCVIRLPGMLSSHFAVIETIEDDVDSLLVVSETNELSILKYDSSSRQFYSVFATFLFKDSGTEKYMNRFKPNYSISYCNETGYFLLSIFLSFFSFPFRCYRIHTLFLQTLCEQYERERLELSTGIDQSF